MKTPMKILTYLLFGGLAFVLFLVLFPESSYNYYIKECGGNSICPVSCIYIDVGDQTTQEIFRDYPGFVERKIEQPLPYAVGGMAAAGLLVYLVGLVFIFFVIQMAIIYPRFTLICFLFGGLAFILFAVLYPERSYNYYIKQCNPNNDTPVSCSSGAAAGDRTTHEIFREYPGFVERKIDEPLPYIVGGVVFLILLTLIGGCPRLSRLDT
jgi:hypothetical protein